MKGKNTFHLFEQAPLKWTPKIRCFRKSSKRFKKALHYVWTGRGKIVGCFAKKFKKPITYSHWEKPFAHPNSELFTKNSKIPLIMFALREAKFGIIFEKFFKNFFVTANVLSSFQKIFWVHMSWRQNCRHFANVLHLFGIRRQFCTP